MKQTTAALQQLKGVGEVLSGRLVDAGYDTFAKVAAAGEEGLAKIRGINPRMLGSIVAQAGELAGEAKQEWAERGALLRQRANALK
ncbi:MAG TPA: helix-hairpin-helix domain-containing protein, partial [Geobacteraceae bacterium]